MPSSLGHKNAQSVQNDTGYLFLADKISQREYVTLAEQMTHQDRLSPQKAHVPCSATLGRLSFRSGALVTATSGGG